MNRAKLRRKWSTIPKATPILIHSQTKDPKKQKDASVDINITIDILRHCYHKDVEAVYILTGDGDYIPIIEEAMRTRTRVFVGAFNKGLNQELRVSGDEFLNLDSCFFR